MALWMRGVFALWICAVLAGPVGAAETPTESSSPMVTEDPVLLEQITKVHKGLQELEQQMALQRRALESETSEVRKAKLYEELDQLRRDRQALGRLLDELVDEARATQWTTIDEALKRAKPYERTEERQYQKEEVLRDRQS